jgi:hypothetical protein
VLPEVETVSVPLIGSTNRRIVSDSFDFFFRNDVRVTSAKLLLDLVAGVVTFGTRTKLGVVIFGTLRCGVGRLMLGRGTLMCGMLTCGRGMLICGMLTGPALAAPPDANTNVPTIAK